MDDRIEQRKKVAAAMDSAMDIARENEVGPLAFSDLMMSMASALYKSQGRPKEEFLQVAAEAYDRATRPAKVSTLKH